MKGLDLKTFKKVATNKEFTTMKSDKGHEIKIAHSGLAPHRKAQLDNLPLHAAEGIDMQAATGQEQPQVVTPAPTLVQQAQQASVGAQDPSLPDQQKQKYLAEDQAWAQDLASGHITPETYHSLFAKKDTLGKIGTLFGLMVSGAGSGLAHQPNAVMGMMDQELKNDLEAQKQSKDNAQNFLKIHLAQEKQKGELAQMGAETSLTQAQAEEKSLLNSYMKMSRAALHNEVLKTQKLPPGSPERMRRESALGMLANQVNNEHYQIVDRLSAMDAQSGVLNQQGQGQEQQFQRTNTALRLGGNAPLAQDRESKHYPGLDGQASVPLNGEDRAKLDGGFQFQQQLSRFIDWTKKHSGDLNPSDIKEGRAMAADLQGAYRQATHGGVYKEGEQNFISKLIAEDPTVFFNKIRVLPSLHALSKENVARINETAKHLGFNGYAEQKEKPANGATGTHNGRPVVFENGKWKYR